MRQTVFSVVIHSTSTTAVISGAGELDVTTAAEVDAAIDECLRAGAVSIDLDLSGTTFMGCAGINGIIAARVRAAAAGSTLSIIRPSRRVERVLTLGNATHLLKAGGAAALAPASPME